MDGSSLDLMIIPIVAVISLAVWLIAVAYAASHPQWKKDVTAGAGAAELTGAATDGSVRDFALARSGEGYTSDEHVGQVAA
jgi:hypothetical protein